MPVWIQSFGHRWQASLLAGWQLGSGRRRRRCGMPRLAAAAALIGLAGASACAGTEGDEQARGASPAPFSLALYALSRGQGVPPEAKAALAEARSMLEDLQAREPELAITEERIGLEGETRLCVTFPDAQQAERAEARLQAMTAGVDLLNLTREPCDRPPG
jgi:hypothetical protein